jgi:hypothetical protein
MRLGVLTFISACVVAVVAAAPAFATGYQGDVDYWGRFTVTIADNQVTALEGHSGSIPCGDGTSINPVTFTLPTPVAVTDGKFHVAGTTLDDYRHTITWSLDASVSVSRTILGTVSLSGPDPTMRKTCSKTFRVAAIIPPRPLAPPAHTKFVDATPPRAGSAPQVNFDYRRGVVTHLSANAGTMCGESSMGARLYTMAYRLDPVQVNAGRFRIVADVLDDYSVVTHVVVSGRISGRTATGTIDSSRYWDVNGTLVHCTQHLRWTARSEKAPPAIRQTGGAYYQVAPYRFGRPGAWSYYLAVKPFGCVNHVTAVRFHVAGAPTRTVRCNTIRKLGPLRPKQQYRLAATALRTRRGHIFGRRPLADSFVYLPGDDAAWTPVPPIP